MASLRRSRSTPILALAGASSLLGVASADVIWDGSADDLWTTGANWQGGVAPSGAVNDNIVFGNESGSQGNHIILGADDNYTGLTGISFTDADGGYTISGSGSFSFTDGSGIENDSTFTQQIDVDLIGTGVDLFLTAQSAALILGGDVDLSDTGGVLLTIDGDFDVTIHGVISGAGGALLKDGAGTLTLNGANTYDGTTTLMDGSIILGDDAALGTGALQVDGTAAIESNDDDRTIANDIVLNDTLTVSGSNDLTLDGTISGAEGLTVDLSGAGTTLTLNGANSYAGGTDLSNATVTVGHDTAFGTGDVTISLISTVMSDDDARSLANDFDLASTLTIDGDFDLALTGSITGDAGLVKSGDGTLLLTGTNNYDGETAITGGVLQAGGGDALPDDGLVTIGASNDATLEILADETIGSLSGGGPSDGDVRLTGGDLTIDQDTTTAFAGSITGTGALLLTGNGQLSLTGTSSYSGGTVISGDGFTLGIGSNSAIGTGLLSILADSEIRPVGGGRLVQNQIDLGADELTISGSFAIEFAGSVNLIGGDRIFEVTNTARAEFSGVIANGSLTKSGAGLMILSGDNTYAGLTTVDEGELRLDGSIAGDAQVDLDGTLSGTGIVHGDLVNSAGGNVSPGDSIGTLTIDGNYLQQASSTLTIEVNAEDGTSDRLEIGGTATLNADSTVEVTLGSSNFIASGDEFTVIQAQGGVFDNGAEITTTSVTLNFELLLDPDFEDGDVLWTLEAVRLPTAFEDAGLTANNQSVGRGLDSLVDVANSDPDGEAADLIGELDQLTLIPLNDAMLELSPEAYNAAVFINANSISLYHSTQARYLFAKRMALDEATGRSTALAGMLASETTDPAMLTSAMAAQDAPVADPAIGRPWEIYGRFYGQTDDLDGTVERTGYDADIWGAQAGVDYAFSRQLIGGVGVAYSHSDADFDGNRGDLEIDSFRIGPYLTAIIDGEWWVDVSGSFAWYNYDGTRNMPTLGRTASADFDGFDLVGYAGTGLDWKLDNTWTLVPYANIQYAYFDFESFTESGAAGANLDVEGRRTDSLRSRLGIDVSFRPAHGTAPTLFDVFLGWQHEFLDPDDVTASFAPGSVPFGVTTTPPDRDYFFYGCALSTLLSEGTALYLRYEGSTSSDVNVQSITGGVNVQF